MEPIFNKKTVKSLFKAPKGQKYPPPPPPINSILRGCILFVLLMVGLTIEAAAQKAKISLIRPGSRVSSNENDNLTLDAFRIEMSAAQSSSVKFKLCLTSNLPTVGLRISFDLSNIIILNGDGCHSNSFQANTTIRNPFVLSRAPNAIDEPTETVTVTISEDANNPLPSNVSIDTDANSIVYTITDDDPTIVMLARTGSSGIEEGETVEFTVTLGRSLITGEIIDVPLIVSGNNITTADWNLTTKTGGSLNTGVMLVNENTVTPVVRFSGVGSQTATLLLTAAADNTAEIGSSETLTLALGPNDATANGFDLNTRMTNVGGGADPDDTDNTFSVTINDKDTEAPMPDKRSLDAIERQCELTKTQLDGMAPSATDNHPGMVTVTNNITTFPVTSDTTITWTYTDVEGNTAIQTQKVTIRDTMKPVPNPDNDLTTLTAACSLAIGDITIPTAMDNCDGPIMATTTITLPITKSVTITWTYRDAAGNTATQIQEVTIRDNTPPTPDPSNDLSEIMRQCPFEESELTTPTATDNCTGSVTVTNNISNFPITSDTTITWTYTDGANNTATQTQQVTIRDNTNPVPATADLPTLEACSQITSLTVPTATDNCTGLVTVTNDVTSFPIMESRMITWTYTDGANNTTTQTQEVIIGDTEAPVPEMSNLPTLTGGCPVATMADLTAPTATDNCDAGTITATTDAAIFPITSMTTITWMYTDAAGNTSTQTQEVICPLSAANDAEEAIIFPNPSGDYLEVRSTVGDTFKILSLSGKPLLEGTTNIKMDITSLQSGLYLVQLPDGRLLKFVSE